MKTLRDRIERFIFWLEKELKECSKNCPIETKW
jgi:hypothetical protein